MLWRDRITSGVIDTVIDNTTIIADMIFFVNNEPQNYDIF